MGVMLRGTCTSPNSTEGRVSKEVGELRGSGSELLLLFFFPWLSDGERALLADVWNCMKPPSPRSCLE